VIWFTKSSCENEPKALNFMEEVTKHAERERTGTKTFASRQWAQGLRRLSFAHIGKMGHGFFG